MEQQLLTEDAIRAFQDDLILEEKSGATLEKYLRDIRAFSAFAGERSVTKELVMAYKQSLLERGYAVRSINSMLAYAKKSGIRSGEIFVTRSGKPLNRSNIWAQMKALCEKAGVKASKVFPHNLRKLFARTFYGVEKDIAKLADILGHSSINTTRIYIMTTGVEHRRKIERLGLVL